MKPEEMLLSRVRKLQQLESLNFCDLSKETEFNGLVLACLGVLLSQTNKQNDPLTDKEDHEISSNT